MAGMGQWKSQLSIPGKFSPKGKWLYLNTADPIQI